MKREIKVLLVEDSPGDAELMRITLEDIKTTSYSVHTAARLAEAHEFLTGKLFDLCILDLGLPDSQGLATIQSLAGHHPNLPIVVLTGNSDEMIGLAAVQIGAQDFLIKGQISTQLLSRVLHYAVERKLSEITARNSEIQLRTILDTLDDQILLLDTDHRVVWPNARTCNACGLSREQIIGLYCYELWSGQTGRCSDCPVERTFATGVSQYVHRCLKEGKTWDIKASPVRNQAGVITGAVELRVDVSEQVSMEEQFRQAQKMEAVGRLAGGIAHDFNNMLSVILGFSEIIKRSFRDNSELQENIDEIIGAGLKSADLVRQLLAFSRRQQVTPQTLDCGSVLKNSKKMLARLLGEDIILRIETVEPLPLVFIDPSQLDQVIANLTINARDAIHPGGTIIIKSSPITLTEKQCRQHDFLIPGEYVLLSCVDNGCGMSKDVLERIFEPFFTTKELGKGTGLGMSTIYGIIKQNNGYITIESEEGKGSSVCIYLPVYHGESVTAVAKPEVQSLHGNETILVVEDEPSILKLCRSILSKYGYTVITANDPEEAIKLADGSKGQIDLLITDVIMPKLNGKDLRRKIEVQQPLVKTLFMSGYTSDVLANQGISSEGMSFLQKPFNKQQLAYRVREMLESDENSI